MAKYKRFDPRNKKDERSRKRRKDRFYSDEPKREKKIKYYNE